jgi:hypothetical protein
MRGASSLKDTRASNSAKWYRRALCEFYAKLPAAHFDCKTAGESQK